MRYLRKDVKEYRRTEGRFFVWQFPITLSKANFYKDDVYAGEAIRIRKVKYITSWQRYKLIKIFVDDEDYEKIFDIINEYCMPLQMKNEF